MIISFIAAAFLTLSPSIDMDLGYGRVVTQVGKPSSEMMKLCIGARTDGDIYFKIAATLTAPTTLPTSFGLQGEIAVYDLWWQLGVSRTTKRFITSYSFGWYIFGAELQLRENKNGNDLVAFIKMSFSPLKIFNLLNNGKKNYIK